MQKSKSHSKRQKSDEPIQTKNNILLDINYQVFNHIKEAALKEVRESSKKFQADQEEALP